MSEEAAHPPGEGAEPAIGADGAPTTAAVLAAVARRTRDVVDALAALDDRELRAPSALPGWDRLTIACHLRYGAEALARMTSATLAGEPASYYPGGRDRQRPETLHPARGESPADVVASLASLSERLHDLWAVVADDQWQLDVVEPQDNRDLGAVPLAALPILRLTEMEVHGTDLRLGLDDWSATFVHAVLPFRLEWLNRRRSNPCAVDGSVSGSWLLVATDGPCYQVTITGAGVESRPAARDGPADAVIEASSRDMLALLLGRPLHAEPRYGGDEDLARAFSRAFPGP